MPTVAARAEAGLGRLAFEAGAHAEACGHLERALASAQLAGDELAAAQDLLGRSLALLARFDEARAVFERALAEGQDEPTRMRFAVLLANLLIDRGDVAGAEEALAGVLDAARAGTDPVALANLYWSQARLHASESRPELAARYARLAHGVLEATEHTLFAAKALLLRAHLENDRGRSAEALELVEEAAPLFAAAGNRFDEGMLLLERARALVALGDREEAASIALGAIPRFEDAHPTSAARGYAIAAGVFRELGDPERALELYELAAETSPAGDRHLVDTYRALAELHEAAGRPDEAMAFLKRALAVRDPVTRS
jgi:tetratricopeptide (TPR) repeat protein